MTLREKEIVEKKIINAKESGELQCNISPEESKAVYLKKMDAAQQSADPYLNDMSIYDGDGSVVASSNGGYKGKYDPTTQDGHFTTSNSGTRPEHPAEDVDGPTVTHISGRLDIHGSAPAQSGESWGRWFARRIVDPMADVGDAAGHLYDYMTSSD